MIHQNKVQLWRGFLLRIVLPSLLAIILFIVAIYVYILPAFEENMLKQKREMIHELTNSSWSILQNYYQQEQDSLMSRETLQQKALSEIQSIRYGKERKDYFWINDMRPYMIMHPYTTQLNGQDLSNFYDKEGKKLFIESVELVQEQGEGFIDYMWQWKDDSTRIVPKLSFVKGFAPWGWVIGTGVYIEDVKQEIAAIESQLITITSVIVILISILFIIIIIHSSRTEQRKLRAEADLLASREKYRTLLESSKEGAIMLVDSQTVYVNSAFANLSEYSVKSIMERSFFSFFNRTDIERFLQESFLPSEDKYTELKAALVKPNQHEIPVQLNISKVTLDDKIALSVLVKDIRKDQEIEAELDTTKEQFRTLSENIEIGVFRTTVGKNAKFIEANKATLEILGYEDKNKLFSESIFDLFIDENEKQNLLKELMDKGKVKNHLIQLKRPNQKLTFINVSLCLLKNVEKKHQYCDGVIEDVTAKRLKEEQKEHLFDELQASQYFMNQSIKRFTKQALFCEMDIAIHKVAKMMKKNNTGAIIVRSETLNIGMVTDQDLRNRVLAHDLDPSRPVAEIMSSPLISLSESSFVFEAVVKMQNNQVRHLCVHNSDGKIDGIISVDDLRELQLQSSSFLIKDIQLAEDIDDIKRSRENLKTIIKSMIKNGANTEIITGVMASVFDLITEKLINFTIEEIGEAPAEFAFIGLGSEGRGEETLLTDQDNAIIYADVEDKAESERIKQYFDLLGTKVCDGLNDLGYDYCMGKIMAKNSKWAQPLGQWKDYFTSWISNAKAQDLLEINIFFDFRVLYGNQELINSLRNHISDLIQAHPQFMIYMAQNILLYKPPLNMFGNIVLESKDGKADTFNIKEAMVPLVSFARIYSIKHTLSETNTLKRLEILKNKQNISNSTYREIKSAYHFLMQLRLKNQMIGLQKNNKASNQVAPKDLSNLDSSSIKKVFGQIQNFQSKINFDFLGGRQ